MKMLVTSKIELFTKTRGISKNLHCFPTKGNKTRDEDSIDTKYVYLLSRICLTKFAENSLQTL